MLTIKGIIGRGKLCDTLEVIMISLTDVDIYTGELKSMAGGGAIRTGKG